MRAPYVTANVTLWPQTGRPARQSEPPGGADRAAARVARSRRPRTPRAARPPSPTATPRALKNACQSGARFATASPADLAALRARLRPGLCQPRAGPPDEGVHRTDPGAEAVHPGGAPLAIPAGCTGKAPEQPGRERGTEAPADLNGTYRYLLTKEDARKGGDPESRRVPDASTR